MPKVLARTTLREKAQVTLPSAVRAALHIDSGDDIEFTVDASGKVYVQGLKTVPADQAWFWTTEWQQREAEASADYAAGQTTIYTDGAEFLASLDD